MEQKSYPITQEIEDKFLEASTAKSTASIIADSKILTLFLCPLLYTYTLRYQTATRKAWEMVTEMYPETKGLGLTWGSSRYPKEVYQDEE